jgi:hypothetical protein
MDNKYNRAHLADFFSNTQSHVDSFPGKYYKYTSSRLAEYTSSIDFDRRNIATGGVDLSIFPWEMFADTNERSLRTYTISQVFQDLIYQLCSPRKVLICGADYSSTRIVQCCETPDMHVTLVNNTALDYFEKCVKTINKRFSDIKYETISMQDLVNGSSSKFDLIEVWANQLDTLFADVKQFTSLLSPSGVLLINGTSDWSFLYENETSAHPMYDLHEQLKFDDSVYTFHVPLHYGFTVVTKK